MSDCYCNSNKPFAECCEPLLKGDREAATPEELMRSRYSAFCTKNMDYIRETTDPQTRYSMDYEATGEWMNTSDFLKLEILKSSMEGNKGAVEFKAYFRSGDLPPQVHHELSKFRKQGGSWYFHDGKAPKS
jgi:SEC-C motif-containing protein